MSRGVILFCVALLTTTLDAGPHHAQQGSQQIASPAIVAQYKPVQDFVSLHEPVMVLFSVNNSLPSPIVLTLGAQNIQFFELKMTSPTGQALEEYWSPTREVNLVTIGSGKVEVQPGTKYELPLLVSQWFHLDVPGTYFLSARLTTNIEVAGESDVTPSEETIRIVVKPRDPARLQKVCMGLLDEVASAHNAEAAQTPALQLSYVDDPVAIPYLARLFGLGKLTDHFTIAGLERIDTDDAVRVLVSALHSGLNDRTELSRHALMRMQDSISDPRLKQTVKRALASKPNS